MTFERVVVEADGGSRGNPGPAGYGAVVLDAATGEVLAERGEAIGIGTNNVAEYRGLIAGLRAAAELGARVVLVRMDSKLVVEQMNGRWQVKHPSMRPLAREAVELRGRFDEVTIEWIPRERNKRADRLANEAMDRAAGIAPKRPRAMPGPTPTQVDPAASASASFASSGSSAPSWTPPTATATRLVLVRHGSTEHSAERRFSGNNALPLNDVGRAQAAALARRAPRWGGVAAVVSSPLRRAVQTADAIAVALGVGVEIEAGFREVDFGAWEGLTFAEARAAAPQELSAWLASPELAPPDGESFTTAGVRVQHARDAVIAAHPGATVVVVTHVTPIKLLLRFALEAPPVSLYRLHLDVASVSTVEYYADGNCSVRLVNDTSHLD
ncbi:MAG: ribonuclease / adenosylcobalamin/alpha-ribazole phosphatase [Pseudonocardiales bacterium]|nr:ribonuclease / adenosylcobalamin/alpha-ribazole phosphatase [Pseudonocardiales bacterium]